MSSVTISNTGVLSVNGETGDVVVPPGATGPQGVPGGAGPAGPTGATGPTGASGVTSVSPGGIITASPTTGAVVVGMSATGSSELSLAADVALTGAAQNVFQFNSSGANTGAQIYRYDGWLTLTDIAANLVDIWISSQPLNAGSIFASTTISIAAGEWVCAYLGCWANNAFPLFLNCQAQNAGGQIRATTAVAALSAPRSTRAVVTRVA